MILGIDASLTSTGICVLNSGKVKFSTTLFTEKTKIDVDRLIDIESRLVSILLQYPIELAIIENYSFMSVGRLASIGELGGIIKILLRKLNIPLYIVSPRTLKKFCNSNKSPGKNKVMLEVYKRFKVEFKDDNQTDAFVLAKIGEEIEYLHKNKQTSPKLKTYEKEVVLTVFNSQKLNIEENN